MLLRDLFSTTAIIEGRLSTFTDVDIKKIRSLYNQGVRPIEIARQLGRSRSSISKLLDKLYPDREKQENQPFTDEDKTKVQSLYNQGVRPIEIARQLGRNISSIWQLLDRLYPDREKKEQRPFTDEDKTKVQSLYNQGVRPIEIARQLGRAENSIVHLLNQLYPDREKKEHQHFTDEEKTKVQSLYDQGFGPIEIARQLGRANGSIGQLLDRLYPNREKQQKRPFTDEEIETMRELFLDGKTLRKISRYLERAEGSVHKKIKEMEDFETVLLPNHLEKREALNNTISDQERDLVASLQAVPDMPPFQTNKWIYRREIKRFYNIDILIPLDNGQTIAVEYFGDYYHAGPKYAEDYFFKQFGMTAATLRAYDNDKMDYLRSLYGEKNVVLIWEHEWLSDPKSCVSRVVDAVRAASR